MIGLSRLQIYELESILFCEIDSVSFLRENQITRVAADGGPS
jgi:hypothetical protein